MLNLRIAFLPALIACLTSSCQPSPGAAGVARVQPTFDDISAKIFSSNCTTRSCHGAAGAKGNLVLTPDVAYDNLVNVSADNDVAKGKGKKRVVPGDAANSFLLQKLMAPAPGEGDQMPQRGQALAPEDIDAIKTWIANGAKR